MANPNIVETGKSYRFQKGNTKGGRTHGAVSIATKLKHLCAQKVTIKNEKRETAEWIALSLIKQAMQGNVKAINSIMDYVDGKPAQTNIVQGDKDNPIQHNVNVNATKEQWDERMRALMGDG